MVERSRNLHLLENSELFFLNQKTCPWSVRSASPCHPRLPLVISIMLFCPRCSNLLLLGVDGSELRFVCQTCPYIHNVTQKMHKTLQFDRKNVAEVESEKNWTNEDTSGAWRNKQVFFSLFRTFRLSFCSYPHADQCIASDLPYMSPNWSLFPRTTDTFG